MEAWKEQFYANEIYMAHHGVKGQQWGKMNGPPYPLSRQGSERYSEIKKQREKNIASKGESSEKESESENKNRTVKGGLSSIIEKQKEKSQAKKEAAAQKKAETERAESERMEQEAADAKSRYEATKEQALKSGSAEDVLKFRGDLTNNELFNALNRIRWEQQLEDLIPKEKSKLDKTMDNITAITKRLDTAVNWYNTGKNTWNAIADIHNAFSDTQWNKIGQGQQGGGNKQQNQSGSKQTTSTSSASNPIKDFLMKGSREKANKEAIEQAKKDRWAQERIAKNQREIAKREFNEKVKASKEQSKASQKSLNELFKKMDAAEATRKKNYEANQKALDKAYQKEINNLIKKLDRNK